MTGLLRNYTELEQTIHKQLRHVTRGCTEMRANAYANLNTQTNPKNPFRAKAYHNNTIILTRCKIAVQSPNFEKLPTSPQNIPI